MNKEMEEILILGLVIFVGLRLLGTTSTATALQNQSNSQNALDLGLAGTAAGVLNTAINDWS